MTTTHILLLSILILMLLVLFGVLWIIYKQRRMEKNTPDWSLVYPELAGGDEDMELEMPRKKAQPETVEALEDLLNDRRFFESVRIVMQEELERSRQPDDTSWEGGHEEVVAEGPAPAPQTGASSNLAERFAANDLQAKLEAGLSQEVQPPQPEADVVQCSVYAPNQAVPGEEIEIQAFAHLYEQSEAVDKLVAQLNEELRKKGQQTLDARLSAGDTLAFRLELTGAHIDEPEQTLTWMGQPASVVFYAEIPEEVKKGYLKGVLHIVHDNVPIGRLRFRIKLSAQPAQGSGQAAVPEATRYRKAFISYASADRPEVLKRTQMLSKAGISFFQDILSLEPGQRWEQELYKHIDQSDLFFLFWTTPASKSEWVMREVDYALLRSKQEPHLPEIVPVPIEGPPIPEPPKQLAHIHFNDKMLYFIR